jgi:hypothetical protein
MTLYEDKRGMRINGSRAFEEELHFASTFSLLLSLEQINSQYQGEAQQLVQAL